MQEFQRLLQIRWSDLDPNFHTRHSVYYDWGAFCRIEFFNQYELTADVMRQLHVGPILFREECTFRKEIRLGDEITINLVLTKSRKDFSRWSIRHQIKKAGDIVAATIVVDGAWINLKERKLGTPPEHVHKVFAQMPQAEGFEWL